MRDFSIAFHYAGAGYAGLVSPRINEHDQIVYLVRLESDNQENAIELIGSIPDSDIGAWVFTSLDGQPLPEDYDQDLLYEIGEAIEEREV